MKKIIALILVLICCLPFASCSKDDAPDGMHLVSFTGEPFKLYVPEVWKDNTSSGVSGAYFSMSEKITVSARYYKAVEGISLDDYVKSCEAEYALYLEDYMSEGIENAVLGGENARELVFMFEDGDVDYTSRQLITKYSEDFIILSFYCPSDRYDDLNEMQFDTIVSEFRLCERVEDTGNEVTDKHTPEGMKIASSDKLQYVMYVPSSWICDSESGASEAYVSESGRPNVTVTAYSYDEAEMTPEQYFEKCEDEYEDVLSEYEFVESTERVVSERDAISYVYTANVGGIDVKIMQTVYEYNAMIYSFTYTAREDRFDAHLDDVEAMLDAFRFR